MASKFSLEAILSLTDNLTTPYKKSTQKITALNKGLTGSFGTLSNGINKAFVGGAKVAGGALVAGVGLASVAIKKFTSEASKIEDITASFTPMLGGVEKANKLVDMLNETAATTPFQLENIAESATQLLPAMNGDLEKTVDTFRMLGDTAGGNAEKLSRISAVYSRVMLKNKLETGDLNILTERGIPIYKELSESMGVSVSEMAKMASQGKITGTDLTKAFKNMTTEGGVFYKGMDIASQTLTGRISTLKDNISLTASKIGTALLPVIKSLTDKAITLTQKIRTWVDANQDLIAQKLQDTITSIKKAIENIDFAKMIDNVKAIGKFIIEHKGAIKGLVVTLGIFEGAVLLVNGAMAIQQGLMLVGPVLSFIKVISSLAKTEGILQVAQYALNLAMTANPIGAIIMAVVAIIALLIGLGILIYKNRDAIVAFFIAIKDLVVKGFQKIAPVLETIGKGFMTYLLAPVNLVIEAIQGLLTLLSKIPGVGDKLQPALDALQGFQDNMNKVTLLGGTNTTNTVTNDVYSDTGSIDRSSAPPSVFQQIEKEKANQTKESNQRFDINLNAPMGYGLSTDGSAPSTAINLGGNQ